MDTWQLQQIVVDGLKLVGQRVNTGNGESKVGVELVGDTEGVCLNADPENLSVAVVCEMGLLNLKLLEIGAGERHLPKTLGVQPAQTYDPRAGAALANGLHAHRFAEERARYDLSLDQRRGWNFGCGLRHADCSLNPLARRKPVVFWGSRLA